MPNPSSVDWEKFLIEIIVLILSIAVHEFGHAFAADRLGDPTPRRQGRVTLWPDKHLDPLGFIMILITSYTGMGIGWGRPVLVNQNNFRHPRRDMMVVAAAGPFMNLILALVFGLTIRIVLMLMPAPQAIDWMFHTVSGSFVWLFLELNVMLMLFNLIPIHPLDGGKLLSGVLPYDQAMKFDRFFYQFGPVILLLVVFSGTNFLGQVIGPPMSALMRLITGI